MARNGLLCADVPLRNYSINQKRYLVDSEVFLNFIFQSLRASFVTVRATHYMVDDEGYKLLLPIHQLHVGYLHKLRTSKKILILLLIIKSLKNA